MLKRNFLSQTMHYSHFCRMTFLLLTLITLCGCNHNSKFRNELIALDSVLKERPDSVYDRLIDIESEAKHQSLSDRMYYELLKADAQNKAYIDFTTDSVMLIVADYYDHHGTSNDQLRAHYLLGCTYRDLKDVPMELQCFQDAAEKADTTQQDCDLYTLYAVYGQIAYLYHNQFLPEEELKSLEMCEKIALLDKDTLSAVTAYSLRVRAFELLDMNDSLLQVTQNAFMRFCKIGNNKHAAQILGGAIKVYIDLHEYDKANDLIEIFKKQSGDYDNTLNRLINPSIMHYHLGCIALHNKDYKVAEENFRSLFNVNQDEAACNGLLELYKELSRPDSIAKYAILFADANDASYLDKNTHIIEQMSAMYNYSRHEQIAKARALESANAKRVSYIISITSLIIFFMLIIAIVVIRYRSKEKEQLQAKQAEILLKRYNETKQVLAELENEKYVLEAQKEQDTYNNEIHIERLLQTISSYEEEKSELEDKLKEFVYVTDDVEFNSWYQSFLDCNVVSLLRAKTIINIKKPEKIEDVIWIDLKKHIRKQCPEFLNIIEPYSLNDTYQQIILLNTIGFSNKEISILLNKTSQQISNIHHRLSKKLFPTCKDTRRLKQNLQEILRKNRI